MSRSLRPRNSRVNYAQMLGAGDNEDPEVAAEVEYAEMDSGDDFAPDVGRADSRPEDSGDDDEESAGSASDLDFQSGRPIATVKPKSSSSPSKKASYGKGKLSTTLDVIKPVFGGSTLSRTSKRQHYVLPTPSVNHRHRAVPLFRRHTRVERLTSEPVLFKQPAVVPTNSFTIHPRVTDHVNKAWGLNVGGGPLWELVEDRGWYKEALPAPDNVETESNNRPRVHTNIRPRTDMQILTFNEANPYLPKGMPSSENGSVDVLPTVRCLVGPLHSQTRIELKMFQSLCLSQFVPENVAHIFNVGSSTFGLDWCPIHYSDRKARSFKQYIAVAPLASDSYVPEVGVRVSRPSKACIQIWSFSSTNASAKSKSKDNGMLKCEMVLCVDSGVAHEIKWCPLPTHDLMDDPKRPRKLGLLGGTFEDGTFSVFVVPDSPDTARTNQSLPLFIKLTEPLLRIQLEETNCLAFDWANSEKVAIGTTHGTIAVYSLGNVFKRLNDDSALETITDIHPTHYLNVHQSAIRTIAWIRAPQSWSDGSPRTDSDPTVIASGGFDGMECLTDIREGHGSVMNRTRDVINTMTFSTFGGGPITIDHENVVKAYSASPSMLGRGHTLLEPQGPVWSLHASDYHPQLAVGSADGACYTTNILRSTRRGSSVPFLVHRIYQLDYSRNTGEYRMLDRFLPQETYDKLAATRHQKSNTNKTNSEPPTTTGTWPRQVGVQRVVWNQGNGLVNSALLASATGSGLCRIDLLWGRWVMDKVPYTGIEEIRCDKEVLKDVDENAMDLGSDSGDDA